MSGAGSCPPAKSSCRASTRSGPFRVPIPPRPIEPKTDGRPVSQTVRDGLAELTVASRGNTGAREAGERSATAQRTSDDTENQTAGARTIRKQICHPVVHFIYLVICLTGQI